MLSDSMPLLSATLRAVSGALAEEMDLRGEGFGGDLAETSDSISTAEWTEAADLADWGGSWAGDAARDDRRVFSPEWILFAFEDRREVSGDRAVLAFEDRRVLSGDWAVLAFEDRRVLSWERAVFAGEDRRVLPGDPAAGEDRRVLSGDRPTGEDRRVLCGDCAAGEDRRVSSGDRPAGEDRRVLCGDCAFGEDRRVLCGDRCVFSPLFDLEVRRVVSPDLSASILEDLLVLLADWSLREARRRLLADWCE